MAGFPHTGAYEPLDPHEVFLSHYGAKGDLKMGATATTTGGSAAVTLSDAALTSSDVGKTVVINQAGGGTVDCSWQTTISAVTSATTFTAATTAPATTTGAPYAYGTDDTGAFAAAIVAGQALGVSAFDVVLDDVGYMVAGALQTSNGYNAQIPLPYITNIQDRLQIGFRGATQTSPQSDS